MQVNVLTLQNLIQKDIQYGVCYEKDFWYYCSLLVAEEEVEILHQCRPPKTRQILWK